MVNAEVRAQVSDARVRWSEAVAPRQLQFTIGLVVVVVAATGACSGGSSDDASPPSTAPTTTAETQENAAEAAESAAIDAFTGLLQVRDAAAQDPLAQDWEPEIRKHAADPAAYAAVESIRTYATLGLHQVGESKVDLQVTRVDLAAAGGPTVDMSGCFDTQASQVVRTESNELVAPGTPPRFTWLITVVQYESQPGQPWLVTGLDPRTDQPC